MSNAVGANEKGRALEDLICFLFPLVPGIEIAQRNALNAFETEEVDVALWNARPTDGFYFLPNLFSSKQRIGAAPAVVRKCRTLSVVCASEDATTVSSLPRTASRACLGI
jgi:hypothetical protein